MKRQYAKKRPPRTAARPANGQNVFSPEHVRQLLDQVRAFCGPLCEAEGLEFVHAEFQREATGRILRIYIDRPGGVSLDDCALVSRQTSDMLDVYLDVEVSYHLEVSSPGAERPLGSLEDFARFKANWVKIKTHRSFNGRRSLTGVIKAVDAGRVVLTLDDDEVAIPYEEIVKARLINTTE